MNKRVLLVSSSGGHWEQLLIVSSLLDDCDLRYLTTDESQGKAKGIDNISYLSDFNRKNLWNSIPCIFKCIREIRSFKPDVIISTGAAPGLVCIILARTFRVRAIWIDSMANAEKLSMSGKIAGYFCNVALTQWEHVAVRGTKAQYWGRIV